MNCFFDPCEVSACEFGALLGSSFIRIFLPELNVLCLTNNRARFARWFHVRIYALQKHEKAIDGLKKLVVYKHKQISFATI